MAIMFMIVAAVLLAVGAQLVTTARKQANQQAYAMAMAQNAAEAGLKDTIGWFRKQTIQPVAAEATPNNYGATPNPTPTYPVTISTNNGPMPVSYSDEAFFPYFNTSSPVSTDTLDYSNGTTIGLVNEFSPDGAGSVSQATTDGSQPRWERYEVQRQLPGASVANAVHDVTGERMPAHFNGQGLVWYLQSTGYYYVRRDFTKSVTAPYYWTKDFRSPPNKLLASAKMATEIRKIYTTLPYSPVVYAALYMANVGRLSTSSNTYVSNDGLNAFAWTTVTSAKPVTTAAKQITGGGTTQTSGAANLGPNNVFGMNITDFANLDSVVKATSNTNFSDQSVVPPNSIIYYNGNLTIDPAGGNSNLYYIGKNGTQTGMLIVNGNFTMNSAPATQNNFYGIVYVSGSVNLNGSTINGVLIAGSSATNGVTLTSSNGNPAAIYYNASYVQRIQTVVSGYLEDISARKVFLAVPND